MLVIAAGCQPKTKPAIADETLDHAIANDVITIVDRMKVEMSGRSKLPTSELDKSIGRLECIPSDRFNALLSKLEEMGFDSDPDVIVVLILYYTRCRAVQNYFFEPAFLEEAVKSYIEPRSSSERVWPWVLVEGRLKLVECDSAFLATGTVSAKHVMRVLINEYVRQTNEK